MMPADKFEYQKAYDEATETTPYSAKFTAEIWEGKRKFPNEPRIYFYQGLWRVICPTNVDMVARKFALHFCMTRNIAARKGKPNGSA